MILSPAPQMLSIRNAVLSSGLGRTKIYALIGAGKIRAVKADSRTLVVARSLYTYLESLPPAEIKHPSNRANGRSSVTGA
jgi:hypothetical protein